jgi:ubiquinone/menaquinone biosynthesis C-methylase UbiE
MSKEHPPVCNYEGSDYQTSFWDQANRSYEDQAEAVAIERLLPSSGHLLLELGAGAGRNTPRYRGFERVVLLDYARTQLRQAQQRLGQKGRYIYVAADIYHLPFVPGLFEATTMIRTLHHIADVPRAFQQIHAVMQTDSVLILEYANKHNFKAILRYILRQQKWSPFTSETIEFAPLNFDFHPRTIRKWLREYGFNTERQLTVSHFRLNFLKRVLPLYWLVRLDALAQPTGNWWQLTPSVFVRSRVSGETPSAEPGQFFCCPVCQHTPLEESSTVCHCSYCGRDWPIEDGIYVFRED